jgi:hypothetical protein
MSGARGGETSTASEDADRSLNVVVLIGELVRPPSERLLPSGDRFVTYEVRVPCPPGRAETVPVVWPNSPAAAVDLDADDQVLVVGRVRRRFYQKGGITQSRTEVVAEAVVLTRHQRRVQTMLARARTRLDSHADRA